MRNSLISGCLLYLKINLNTGIQMILMVFSEIKLILIVDKTFFQYYF